MKLTKKIYKNNYKKHLLKNEKYLQKVKRKNK